MILLMTALHAVAQGYDPKLTIQSPMEIFEATEDTYNYPYKKWFTVAKGDFSPFISYTCLTKDSVINGQNYVASSTIHYTSPDDASTMVICYRQEGDKVYYYSDEDHRDELLFDFGLQVGDKFLDDHYGYLSVAEVGTFPEVAQYLGLSRENKMLRLVDSYDGTDIDIWIEGIGSLKHGILPFKYPYNNKYHTLGLTFHGINDHFSVNLPTFKQQPFEPIDLTMDELRELQNSGKECPCILTATFEEDTLHLTGIMDLNCNSYDMVAILTDNNHISLTIPMYEAEALDCQHRCRYDVKLSGFTCGTYTIDVNERLGITKPITLEQTRRNLTVPYRAEDRIAQYMDETGVHYSDYRSWEYHTIDAEGKPGTLFTMADKDVVLDGQTYVQLTNGWYGDLHLSYMRQVGKQVFRYNPDTKTETLVLDFSLDVGDVFTTECGDRMQVTEVGSFEEYAKYFYTGDGVRRMLRLQGVDNPKQKDVWIEGFGSVYTGVLPPELYAPYPEIHQKWCSDTGNFAINQKNYKSRPFEAEELDRNTCDFLMAEATDEDMPFTCEFIGNDLHLSGYFYYTCSTSQYAELTIADGGMLNLSFVNPATYYPVAACMWPGYFDLIFPDFEPGNYHISLTNLRGHTQEFDLTLEESTPYRPFIEEGKVWKTGYIPLYDYMHGSRETKAQKDFFFDTDTIIDGRRCKKLMCHYKSHELSYNGEMEVEYYEGAMYEQDKKVYYMAHNKSEFLLLYDFGLEINEEAPFDDGFDIWDVLVVDKGFKQSEIFKGNYLHYWSGMTDEETGEFWPDFEGTWMEGIGYCMEPYYTGLYVRKGGGYELMQCTVGDEVIYNNPDIIDGVNPPADETKKRIDFTHIQKPRPKAPRQETDGVQLGGEYTLSLLDLDLRTMSDTYNVTITDNAGKKVYEKAVHTADVLALNIDISQWTAPTYTITVESDSEQYVGTFSPTPTSITELTDPKVGRTDNAIYDLTGRRLTHEPARGLYIRNGRIFRK